MTMYRFGNHIVIGASNNWRKMHGFPMVNTKRHPHERKDIPKRIRIRLHAMQNAGCEPEFIKRIFLRDYGIKL